MQEESKVNWTEYPLVRWLNTTVKEGTRSIYHQAYKTYVQYTKMTSIALIDEALLDAKKDVQERRDILKTRLLGFYKWMTEEYALAS